MTLNKAIILGVPVNSSSGDLLLEEITNLASKKGHKSIIFTPNPEFLVEAQKDQRFKELLNKSDINLPDGIGLVWAGKVLGEQICMRVSGADVVEELLEKGNKQQATGNRQQGTGNSHERWRVGIAGARKGDTSDLKILFANLSKKYPNICFVSLDPNFQFSIPIPSADSGQVFQISNFKFQIVLACQGMKKQEQSIWENKDCIEANVFMGIGGSLDFLGGFTKRAPLFLRKCGLEWFWRVMQKPSHIKRIWKAVFVFGWLVLKERLIKRET